MRELGGKGLKQTNQNENEVDTTEKISYGNGPKYIRNKDEETNVLLSNNTRLKSEGSNE